MSANAVREITVPVAPDVWATLPHEEREVFRVVVAFASFAPLCAWLRSTKPLRPEMRELVAAALEGRYKAPAHRPAGRHPLAVEIEHNARRQVLADELAEIALALKAKRERTPKKSPKEAAKEELARRHGMTERQLKRAMERWRPPRAK